jgi:hypothetical protein
VTAERSSPLRHSDVLQRRVRVGDWQEQRRSTWDLIHAAIDEQDGEAAAELADYSVDECRVIYEVQGQWQADLRAFLEEQGCPREEVEAADGAILAKLDEPDGTPHDRARSWTEFLELTARLQEHARRGEWAAAREALVAQRERWRIEKGRDSDWTYGLMSECVARFGETIVPLMYERIARPLFDWRYRKFDIGKIDWEAEGLPTLLYVSLEAMRAHLSTPRHDGAPLDLVEHDDRWEVRFDPCGSGGRAVRGDAVEGTPSRMEPPYGWKVIEGAYDWTDGKRGVCIYCAHCLVLMEQWSMDRFGYPVRVVEPPLYPTRDGVRADATGGARQTCSWTMYKDPTAAPEEVYARAGRTKPRSFGASAAPEPEPTEPRLPGAG